MIFDYNDYLSKLDISKLTNCLNGFVDSDDCSWYHNNWMTLRSLDIVSNPFWHTSFFADQLKIYFTSKDYETLVLGTADFSMPLLCKLSGIEQLYIHDICKTPLNICDNIAKQYNFYWTTINNLDSDKNHKNRFKIVINDAFLTRFNYNEKPKILKGIKNILSPDGVYITTIRKDWNAGKVIVPSSRQKDEFIEKAKAIAIEKGFDANIAKYAATNYINRMKSYPMKSEDDVFKMAKGILDIVRIDIGVVLGECKETSYFRVVFKRSN